MKHYRIEQDPKGELCIVDQAYPDTNRTRVTMFGALMWTATLARAGHKISFEEAPGADEQTICHQNPGFAEVCSRVTILIYPDKVELQYNNVKSKTSGSHQFPNMNLFELARVIEKYVDSTTAVINLMVI